MLEAGRYLQSGNGKGAVEAVAAGGSYTEGGAGCETAGRSRGGDRGGGGFGGVEVSAGEGRAGVLILMSRTVVVEFKGAAAGAGGKTGLRGLEIVVAEGVAVADDLGGGCRLGYFIGGVGRDSCRNTGQLR